MEFHANTRSSFTNNAKDRKRIIVRYDCAILLTRKGDYLSKYTVGEQIESM
jgi:hypothetical protein